jgi:hypothetical protein
MKLKASWLLPNGSNGCRRNISYSVKWVVTIKIVAKSPQRFVFFSALGTSGILGCGDRLAQSMRAIGWVEPQMLWQRGPRWVAFNTNGVMRLIDGQEIERRSSEEIEGQR